MLCLNIAIYTITILFVHAELVCASALAGATADAFTLFERLEMQLEQHPGEPLAIYSWQQVVHD